jgi:5'-3' exonuclease
MIDVFEQPIMNPTFIFVDGSYFCFYRYYALTNWWKNAYPDEELNNPLENNIFVDKFKKLFIENLQQIPKKLKLDKKTNPILIVGKDCKRENIWRNTLYPQYKATRTQENGFMGGPFFKMAYEEELFQKGGAKAILHHPQLEADDCIAVSVKHLIHKYPKCEIYIITSDKDYLQLHSQNVHLFNMAFKNIADKKSSTGNSNTDLQLKIIMGDISDNIPSVFPKCGPKTALKCIESPEYFASKMANNEDYYKQYELNKKLVCFDNIPDNLINEFMESLKTKN